MKQTTTGFLLVASLCLVVTSASAQPSETDPPEEDPSEQPEDSAAPDANAAQPADPVEPEPEPAPAPASDPASPVEPPPLTPVLGLDTAIYGWDASPVAEQLEADTTLVPPTYGSVFVPSLTTSQAEPEIRVLDATGASVGRGQTGRRIALPPGEYTVLVGSGTAKQMMRFPASVATGATVIVEVKWSALKVAVVDETNSSITGRYELIRLGDSVSYGAGFGANPALGEEIETWLLPPGIYRIVRTAADYRSDTKFLTVYLPEAGVARFKLVENRFTGEILGGGIVAANALGLKRIGETNWSLSLILGADGALAQTINVPGISDQLVLSGNLFVDANATWKKDKHGFSGLLEIEEGFVRIDPEVGSALPVTKSRDEIHVDATYTYAAGETFGPYARAEVFTRVFPTNVLVSEDATIVKTDVDGNQSTQMLSANDTFRVSNALSPTRLRESAGINYAAFRSPIARLNLRTGLGFRQNFLRNVFVEEDDAATPEIEYQEVGSFNQIGLEGGVRLQANLSGYALLRSTINLFADFTESGQVTVEWKNSLGLRITRHLSLEYSLDVIREPELTDKVQVEHGGVVRFTWSVL